MLTRIDKHSFLASLFRDCEGSAKIEINLNNSDARFDGGSPGFVEFWIRLLLGKPHQIAGETVYPVDLPGVATYDAKRDGQRSSDGISDFLMRRALEGAYPGASGLLDREVETPLELHGVRPTDMGNIVEMIRRAKRARLVQSVS